MNAIFVARKIFRQFLRDRRTMALIFLIPPAIMSIFFFMFKDELAADIGLAVQSAERDSAEYAAFIDVLAQADGLRLVEDPGNNPADAIAREGVDAALAFPPGFWEDLDAGRKPTYHLRIEGTRPGVEKALSKLLDAALLRARLSSLPLFRGRSPTSGARAVLSYHYPTSDFRMIDLTAPSFIAFFLFFICFLLTCVAFLRERASGTLERVLISPISALSLISGYLIAFSALGFIQGSLLMAFSTWILGIKTVGGFLWAMVPMMLTVLLGVTMGIFFSELAKNEFQVIQFIPLVIIPQTLLSGIILDTRVLPEAFRAASKALPLTYTVDIIKGMLLKGQGPLELWRDFLALMAFLACFTALSFMVARRAR
jgi:ABC-2 type transport system permease protein